jgi:hypothetical protein
MWLEIPYLSITLTSPLSYDNIGKISYILSGCTVFSGTQVSPSKHLNMTAFHGYHSILESVVHFYGPLYHYLAYEGDPDRVSRT